MAQAPNEVSMKPAQYHMAGIRLGAWLDQGGSVVTDEITADFTDAGFYTELFYNHRFTPVLLGEFALGIAARGDAVVERDLDQYIGTINLYTIMAQVKISPLAAAIVSPHPFIIGGGGVVVGSQTIEVVRTGDGFLDPYQRESETDFVLVLGGGVDFPIAEQVGLNVTGKYHWADFSSNLAGIKDYSGMAISVGVAYLIH